jgi:hypothetical protein
VHFIAYKLPLRFGGKKKTQGIGPENGAWFQMQASIARALFSSKPYILLSGNPALTGRAGTGNNEASLCSQLDI